MNAAVCFSLVLFGVEEYGNSMDGVVQTDEPAKVSTVGFAVV